VIRDSFDVNMKEYDFDLPEHVIVVNDWMHTSIISKYTAFLHSLNGNEAIDGILINGRGVDAQLDPDTKKPLLDYETPRSTFKVSHGKRYRFRMINTGVQYCPLHVSIDNHNLTLIATDGDLRLNSSTLNS
jgi:L-ascorbate oxidase